MAAPVGEFVQRRAVIASSILEGVFRGEMNAVGCPIVKSPVGLIVTDARTGIAQDLLSRLASNTVNSLGL
jgi:hypothetical protein